MASLPTLAPLPRYAVVARCGVEGALNDLLCQDPDLDVPTLGVTGQEGEGLVAVDVVTLHDNADGGADVRPGVECLTQLLHLLGVLEHRSGLRGEQFSQLNCLLVERPRCVGIQVEPRLLPVMKELNGEL